jgi:hypothetical protein
MALLEEQLFTLVLSQVVQAGRLSMNDEFKNEVFSSYDPNPIRTCSQCDKKPAMVRSMLNPKTGRTVRMFKCECGEQTWSESVLHCSRKRGRLTSLPIWTNGFRRRD